MKRRVLSLLDAAVLSKLAPSRTGGLDRLPRAVAEGGLIWLIAAAALAGLGGRFGRRAALRGLLSLVLTSAATHGLTRLIPGRRRPPGMVALPGRLAGKPPKARYFRSGHTASAAAFAVGAGLELPAAGLPFGVTALALGWARVRTRHHHPHDVIAGAVAGAAVAVATRRIWPVAPRAPAQIRPALHRVGADPSPDGTGLSVVVNVCAGSPGQPSVAQALREGLPGAEVIEVDDSADLHTALEKACASGRVLGVAGGDGSINAAAGVAKSHDKPLMIVPAGTLNHLARDLGLIDVNDAMAAMVEGSAVSVDLAMIADEPFLNTASFGVYADLVDARERLEDRIGKWPAALIAMSGVLRHGQPVNVELDGRRRSIWMIFIGNCRYHPAGFTPSWRERLDDGQLDVRVVDASRPYCRTRLLLAVLTGRLGRSKVYDAWTAKKLHVRSLEGPLRLARDGETFDGPEEFEIRKCDERLRVYLPDR